jgi:DNA-binding MarR family transcriptional regulator
MNQVLHALEGRGALSRADSASAGRAMPAQLTRRGKALLKRADTAVEAADQQVLNRLTAEQRDQLKNLLYAAGTR